MTRRMYNPLALLLIGLGAVGFVVKVVTDPLGILEMLAFAAAIVAIFILLYKRFIRKTSGRKATGYQRAAKQSVKLRKKQARKPRRPSHLKVVNSKNLSPKKMYKDSLQKRKKDHNFTVIDGKKRKKKNRALF